jgi:NAD(P)H-binding
VNTGGKIAVAGATGRVGRHVVDVLEEQGHEVVAISRSAGVDVVTGEGLADALSGVEYLVDASSGASPEQQAATDFFTAATRNLQQLGARAGVRRIIVVSIIGTDRFTAGYGAAKQADERAMLAGLIPAAIVRAAQFHEFVAQLMEWGRQDGAIYLPKMRTQLVAARTVAETLADIATGRARAGAGTPLQRGAHPRDRRPARREPRRGRTTARRASRRAIADRGREQPRRPGRCALRVGRATTRPGCNPRRSYVRAMARRSDRWELLTACSTQRTDANAARSSSAKSSGSPQAATWPPVDQGSIHRPVALGVRADRRR